MLKFESSRALQRSGKNIVALEVSHPFNSMCEPGEGTNYLIPTLLFFWYFPLIVGKFFRNLGVKFPFKFL